jgi:hypothetical protein
MLRGALIALLGLASAAHAGIVVLDNGAVLTGDVAVIDSDVVVSLEGGRITVPLSKTRWVDPARERLTEAYWERHWEAPLRDGYEPPPLTHQRWVLRGRGVTLMLPRGWTGGVDRAGTLHFGGRVDGREVDVEVRREGAGPIAWSVTGERADDPDVWEVLGPTLREARLD